jgi:hypothetical protein
MELSVINHRFCAYNCVSAVQQMRRKELTIERKKSSSVKNGKGDRKS